MDKDITLYKNSQYTPTAPLDLDRFHQNVDYIEARHDKAIEVKSELDAALANLDLNPAEDEYRRQLANDIDKELEDSAYHGNYARALNAIIKKRGQLAKDPVLIGKLRNQQEYKKFTETLDARNDITPTDKEHIKSENPYTSIIKYDTNGNPIGTQSFTGKPYYQSFDYASTMANAIKLAAEEKGGGTSFRFEDANGNPVSLYGEGSGAAFVKTTTGNWERLDKNKIMKAFWGLVDSTPGGREAINQDYNFRVKEQNPTALDKNNNPLDIDDYVTRKVNKLADAAKYYNYTSHTSLSEAPGYSSSVKGAATSAAGSSNAASILKGIPDSSHLVSSSRFNVTYNALGTLFGKPESIYNNMDKYYYRITGEHVHKDKNGRIVYNPKALKNPTQLQAMRNYNDNYMHSLDNLKNFAATAGTKEEQEDASSYYQVLYGRPIHKTTGHSFTNTIVNRLTKIGKGTSKENNFSNNKAIIKANNTLMSKLRKDGFTDTALKQLGINIKEEGDYTVLNLPMKYYDSYTTLFNSLAERDRGRDYSIAVFDEYGKDITTKNIKNEIVSISRAWNNLGAKTTKLYNKNVTATAPSITITDENENKAALNDAIQKGFIKASENSTLSGIIKTQFDNMLENQVTSMTIEKYNDKTNLWEKVPTEELPDVRSKFASNSYVRNGYGINVKLGINDDRPGIIFNLQEKNSGISDGVYRVSGEGIVRNDAINYLADKYALKQKDELVTIRQTNSTLLPISKNRNPSLGRVIIKPTNYPEMFNVEITDKTGLRVNKAMNTENTVRLLKASEDYQTFKTKFISSDNVTKKQMLNGTSYSSELVDLANIYSSALNITPLEAMNLIREDLQNY